jgi:hypothetical protein
MKGSIAHSERKEREIIFYLPQEDNSPIEEFSTLFQYSILWVIKNRPKTTS